MIDLHTRIIRYQDPQGEIHFASLQADGRQFRIDGNLLGGLVADGPNRAGGDTVTTEIEKIGALSNPVIDERVI